ncbi:hypothetical protein BDP27DRAFT_1229579, partial [Rhodocollybia butyracea]
QTIKVRLKPTLDNARSECKKFDRKAKMTGYALNVAIGLQVLFGALTTAVSAGTSGKSTSIGLPVIGGMATLVASYLARARGSNEPELSIIRVKDLEQFIRECEAFEMDYGHLANHDHDAKLDQFRRRFEELLGNGNGCVPSLTYSQLEPNAASCLGNAGLQLPVVYKICQVYTISVCKRL